MRLITAKEILEQSYGEVVKPLLATTKGPSVGGLLCQAIFGPVARLTCKCGSVMGQVNYDTICPNCGVICGDPCMRRHRSGHAKLLYPVANPLFYRTIAKVFQLKKKELLEVLNCNAAIKIEKGNGLILKSGVSVQVVLREDGATGAKALLELSEAMDWVATDRKEINILLAKDNTPSDLFLTVLPILPAGIREVTEGEDGRAVIPPINNLYAGVISRQNSIKALRDSCPSLPTLVELTAERMLHKAVTYLFKAPASEGGILASIGGKKGIFRGNLLGKRVDFSGRSILTGSPILPLDECGLPRTMAYELFKPHILNYLLHYRCADNIREALRLWKNKDNEALDALEEVVLGKYIFVNRAPSLHKYSIVGLKVRLHGSVR